MDQIGVVGLSYRHAGTEEIASFAVPREEWPKRLPQLQAALAVPELVFIATCNRVEVVFAAARDLPAGDCRDEVFRALTGRAPAAGEARAALRAWTGEAAVEHLFLLACGLDSAQAGEREIAAQLRLAWQAAREARTCGPTLDPIFGEALAMSHRVSELAALERVPSLADLATRRMLAHLEGSGAAVALVGVSAMTRRCGERLHEAGVPLIVANRTLDAALEFARTLDSRAPVQALALAEFKARPPQVAGVIVATAGVGPVLDEAVLSRLTGSLVVDFGLPANVDVPAARRLGLTRLGMDELIEAAQSERIAHLTRLAPVRAAIDERLMHLRSDLAARAIGPRLARLRGDFERIAGAEAERILAEELQSLAPEQKEHLKRFARTIAHRLAHLPLAGLRAAAVHANEETVEAFFRAARLNRHPGDNERSS